MTDGCLRRSGHEDAAEVREFSSVLSHSSYPSNDDMLRLNVACFSVIFYLICPLYFNQLDAKSKDVHRHEIICTGSTA